MLRKFDQDAKDRMVRLVEDRILAEKFVIASRVLGSSPKAGSFMAHGPSMDSAGPPCRKHPKTRA